MIKLLEKSDRSRVEEIVKTIWEGDDYIPLVFDKWVDDPSCYFMGFWSEGGLIGIDNLRLFSDKVGWMEGMRITPPFREGDTGKSWAKRCCS
jgi:hypothetical protein